MIKDLQLREKECYKKQVMLPDNHDVRAIQCSDIKMIVGWTDPETDKTHYEDPEKKTIIWIFQQKQIKHISISVGPRAMDFFPAISIKRP